MSLKKALNAITVILPSERRDYQFKLKMISKEKKVKDEKKISTLQIKKT
jgi:hypothetical protein